MSSGSPFAFAARTPAWTAAATVSRVLKGDSSVNASTYRRVEDAAAALKYERRLRQYPPQNCLIVLNVLWLVCSLPVVTMGASCAALYQVLGKLIAGEDGHVAGQFFGAWGENWKKATPVWLILLAVAALCGFDLYMARLNDSFLWELLAVFALQLAAMVMTFAFPLMARYENTWRNHLKNAMLVAVGHLPRMLLIWAVWAVPVGVSVFIPEVGFYLSIVWVLIGYSSLSYVTALLLRPVFRNLDENA